VSVLDATTLAAIPALLTSGELPPVLRLTAGRPVPGTAGPTLSTAPVPASPDAADGTAAGRPDADRSAAERAAQGRLATGGRDTTETMLAGLWCDVLGVTEVGAADDFFLLGGDSLMAVHLTARIRNQAGLRIAVPEFVSDATFASLVRLAGAADPAERPDPESRARPGSRARPTNLIVFTESGTRPPLFFVAPGAGSSLVYRELARRVAVDRPCYGLETPGLHDAVAPMTRFEDIAAHHLDLVHRYCPDGPYLLAGWSVGATVAHEMAVQDGRRVDLVVGIDGHVGDAGTLRAGIETARYQAQVRLPWRLARGRLDRFLAAPEGGGPDFAGVFLANLHGMRRYRPGRAPGEAVVFATRLTSRRRRRLTERLAAHYGGGVTVLPASGRHWTVLDEVHLDELAGAIRGVLDQWVAADAAGAASG
jgi:thioesterase domain-containing protein